MNHDPIYIPVFFLSGLRLNVFHGVGVVNVKDDFQKHTGYTVVQTITLHDIIQKCMSCQVLQNVMI